MEELKGFIEVTERNGIKRILNISHLVSVCDNGIYVIGEQYETIVKESYEEIKELIKKAQ